MTCIWEIPISNLDQATTLTDVQGGWVPASSSSLSSSPCI